VAIRLRGTFERRFRSRPERFRFAATVEWVKAMGRRISSLLLFVGGYLAMASLAPVVALAPALVSFFAGVIVLAREPEAARRSAR
jgi:hypothetical protein